MKTINSQRPFHNDFILVTEYWGHLAQDDEGTHIYGWENYSFANENKYAEDMVVESHGGCFGYNGGETPIKVQTFEATIVVPPGFWFSTPSGFRWSQVEYDNRLRLAVWQREGYPGMLTMGRVEDEGRLKYISECHDTLLHAPIKSGYPCLNALYMPENINQKMHTHPSTRSGFIIVGGAYSCTPGDVNNPSQEEPYNEYELETGAIFIMPANGYHWFRSDKKTDTVMKLVAYHPDSDAGVEDRNHPMLNRSIIDGKGANDQEFQEHWTK